MIKGNSGFFNTERWI